MRTGRAKGSTQMLNVSVQIYMCVCACCFNVSPTNNNTQYNLYSTVCFYGSFGSKRKVPTFFRAVLAMPAKCDSFTGAQTHTWHTDGGLCDLCQTYNRCTFVFGYQQTWHQLSRYIHIFFSSPVMRMKKNANKHRKKKHLQFYQPNSRIFHVFTSLDRLIIRINFTTTNGTAVW